MAETTPDSSGTSPTPATTPTPAPSPRSRVVTQAVACDWRQAWALAADPKHLKDWASGLAEGEVHPDPEAPGQWRADTPAGHSRMRFAPANDLGVLDHWVTPPGQGEVYMPFRVIGTGPGQCELQMTLLRLPGMDDAAFERDASWIAKDLQILRKLLEASAGAAPKAGA